MRTEPTTGFQTLMKSVGGPLEVTLYGSSGTQPGPPCTKKQILILLMD